MVSGKGTSRMNALIELSGVRGTICLPLVAEFRVYSGANWDEATGEGRLVSEPATPPGFLSKLLGRREVPTPTARPWCLGDDPFSLMPRSPGLHILYAGATDTVFHEIDTAAGARAAGEALRTALDAWHGHKVTAI